MEKKNHEKYAVLKEIFFIITIALKLDFENILKQKIIIFIVLIKI